jgi:hypothetical protein
MKKTNNKKKVNKQTTINKGKNKLPEKKEKQSKSIKKVVSNQTLSDQLETKRAKRDRVKALEGYVVKPDVSQFELNELIGKLAGEVKKRGRNKNQLKFNRVRAVFDRFN